MKIEWTSCAEKMPPNNCAPVIYRSVTFKKASILYGHQLHWFSEEMPLQKGSEWTPYTPEKWGELNK